MLCEHVLFYTILQQKTRHKIVNVARLHIDYACIVVVERSIMSTCCEFVFSR